MTTMTEQGSGLLTLGYNESALIPVPEGRLVLRSAERGGRQHHLVVLQPHGDAPEHELAAFLGGGNMSAADLLTVALAALDAWR